MEYPTRCKILDIEGEVIDPMFPDITAKTPDVSRSHIGKEGLAERIDGNVRITLDDGNGIWGYECWWIPLPLNNIKSVF